MAGLYRALLTSASSVTKNLTQVSSCRTKFTKSRVPAQVFEERAKEHDMYGGDPEHPHKLHIVTRVKSTMRRPYWEKKVVKSLGLMKAHESRVHKNTPSVNNLLKIIKHLVSFLKGLKPSLLESLQLIFIHALQLLQFAIQLLFHYPC
uniref:Large ribosomal subunit protein uL30m n=1 Tax=Cyprinus carpio carpio TaxID=630221 RepID=A0A9J8C4D1_CYPCA